MNALAMAAKSGASVKDKMQAMRPSRRAEAASKIKSKSRKRRKTY